MLEVEVEVEVEAEVEVEVDVDVEVEVKVEGLVRLNYLADVKYIIHFNIHHACYLHTWHFNFLFFHDDNTHFGKYSFFYF